MDHGPWETKCPVCSYPIWTLTGEKHELLFSRLAEHIASEHPNYYAKKGRAYPELYPPLKRWATVIFLYFSFGWVILIQWLFFGGLRRGYPDPPQIQGGASSAFFIPVLVSYIALGGLMIFIARIRIRTFEAKWKESNLKPASAEDLVTGKDDPTATESSEHFP